MFAVDASSWDRCDAETSPQRGFYYSASKHSAGQPIVAGWSYQWISQLDWAPDSWTAPLDARLIAPTADATTASHRSVRSPAVCGHQLTEALHVDLLGKSERRRAGEPRPGPAGYDGGRA